MRRFRAGFGVENFAVVGLENQAGDIAALEKSTGLDQPRTAVPAPAFRAGAAVAFSIDEDLQSEFGGRQFFPDLVVAVAGELMAVAERDRAEVGHGERVGVQNEGIVAGLDDAMPRCRGHDFGKSFRPPHRRVVGGLRHVCRLRFRGMEDWQDRRSNECRDQDQCSPELAAWKGESHCQRSRGRLRVGISPFRPRLSTRRADHSVGAARRRFER